MYKCARVSRCVRKSVYLHHLGVTQPPSTAAWQNGATFVGAHGVPFMARVVTNRRLTKFVRGFDVKHKWEICVEVDEVVVSFCYLFCSPSFVQEHTLDYMPGDAFYFVFENRADEVDYILKR